MGCDLFNGGDACVDVETVQEFEWFFLSDGDGFVEGEACAHPAIVADVECCGVVGIHGVIHECDAFCDIG